VRPPLPSLCQLYPRIFQAIVSLCVCTPPLGVDGFIPTLSFLLACILPSLVRSVTRYFLTCPGLLFGCAFLCVVFVFLRLAIFDLLAPFHHSTPFSYWNTPLPRKCFSTQHCPFPACSSFEPLRWWASGITSVCRLLLGVCNFILSSILDLHPSDLEPLITAADPCLGGMPGQFCYVRRPGFNT